MNDYDPVGGHTKEEADAEYERLFRELHGYSIDAKPVSGDSGGSYSPFSGDAKESVKRTVYILGPKNPDTDAVCAAVSYAALRNRLDRDRINIPKIAGEVRAETAKVFAKFGVELPGHMEDVAIPGESPASGAEITDPEVILIDHNDEASAFDTLRSFQLVEIIDHHKLGALTTDYPVHCIIRPIGAVSTIIYALYKESGEEPDADIAGLLCAGIISDTKLFQTPETTQPDKVAAVELAAVIGADLQVFAQEILD